MRVSALLWFGFAPQFHLCSAILWITLVEERLICYAENTGQRFH
jgi:hypothetical protein